jgi:hypothetical protein
VKQDARPGRLLAIILVPALRIPLFLVITVGVALLAMYSCHSQMRAVKLMRRRHTSFIRLLARTVCEQEAMPAVLGSLAVPEEAGRNSAIEEVFLRDFAGLEEFTYFAKAKAEAKAPPLERLGTIHVWQARGHEGHLREIAWEGYVFRLEVPKEAAPGNRSVSGTGESSAPQAAPAPGGPGGGASDREFAIFSWPMKPGGAQLTLAYVSTAPDRIFYTCSPRYVGPGKGPRLTDLGEAPLKGRIFILPPDSIGESVEIFRTRAAETGGRIWGVENLPALSEEFR